MSEVSEQTWRDVEEEYIEAEDIARRLGIKFVGNEYVSEEEFEDDWVRLRDATEVIAKLDRVARAARALYPNIYVADEWISTREELWDALKELEES